MSGTILLADDSLTIQKVVELTFADTNYRVVAVSSGDELIERLTDSNPDLIICDVIMPGTDGYEVCQQIKSSSEWLHLPVILLTGTFEPFDRDRAIAAGCSEIITKPFEARKLVDTVERLIGSASVQVPEADDFGPMAASEDDVWPEESTPVEVPSGSEEEGFGTRISAKGPDDDGIEFTTSGFAEMEAAGRQSAEAADAGQSADGLDYDFSVTAEPDPSAQTVKIDVSSYRDEGWDDAEEAFAADEVALAESVAEVTEGAAREIGEPGTSDEEPFASMDDEPFAEVIDDDRGEELATVSDEPSMADTSPVDLPDETAPEGTQREGELRLTDQDIDRIAHRVIELASDRLEQIAWEIVPDMAEVVVRQRIRELEAEVDESAPDRVQ